MFCYVLKNDVLKNVLDVLDDVLDTHFSGDDVPMMFLDTHFSGMFWIPTFLWES